MGYGTVYINPPDHLAVGVLGSNLQGASWIYNRQTYYYCETTGAGFKIGQLPDQFNGQNANVYAIDESRQYVPDLQSITSINPNPIISPYTPIPTPTVHPNPSSSPIVSGPTVQPALPISLNLIAEAPILFVVIVAAIVVCIAIAIRSTGTKKEKLPTTEQLIPEPSTLETADTSAESTKFCIYCGSSNKSFAAYCEKCGKKIA
jgi:hypothetical protein